MIPSKKGRIFDIDKGLRMIAEKGISNDEIKFLTSLCSVQNDRQMVGMAHPTRWGREENMGLIICAEARFFASLRMTAVEIAVLR